MSSSETSAGTSQSEDLQSLRQSQQELRQSLQELTAFVQTSLDGLRQQVDQVERRTWQIEVRREAIAAARSAPAGQPVPARSAAGAPAGTFGYFTADHSMVAGAFTHPPQHKLR